MTIAITSKIVGLEVVKPGSEPVVAEPVAPKLPDLNPLHIRIDERPNGSLEAVSEKIEYYTSQGKKKVYVIVSFVPVEGVLDGQPITVERPIEFFFPIGQLSSEHQWITATMRTISLAARGGFVVQTLADLRKVSWDKGPVRCGLNQWNKPLLHDSEVAAIAWSIQKILYERGFLDIDGNQVPAKVLARNYARRKGARFEPDQDEIMAGVVPHETPVAVMAPVVSVTASKSGENCPDCGGEVVRMDGCLTCTSCGHSKCS